MKIYNLIKDLLTDHPELRDSDKRLIWEVWDELQLTDSSVLMTRSSFLKAPSTETIRRCRQKIQETHPELQSSKSVRRRRQAVADKKGTHIYREEINEQQTLT